MDKLEVYIIQSERSEALFNQSGWKEICIKSANLSDITITTDENVAGIGFISGTEKCIVAINQELDIDAQMEEKTKELQYQLGFVASVEAKLNNERFVSGAPAAVVEKEKAKLADGQERIKILKDDLARLEEMKNA